MKFLPLILRNLLRKKVRTSLTILSIAVALFLYGLLATIDAAFRQGVKTASADRLFIRNKTSFIMPLPYSYRDKIAQISGVSAVTYASWFGGVYQDPKNFFVQFAVDKDTYFRLYSEFIVPKEQMAAFLADREACVVGRKIFEKFKWKIGDRVPIQGTIFAGNWGFNIRGVYDGARPADDTTAFLFRHDYLEERRETGSGLVGWYIASVGDPNQAVAVAKAIDEPFANSAYETRSEPEKVFMAGALSQMGNIRLMLFSVGLVVFTTLLLVTGNTMAVAVRERAAELAVLKTIGFSDVAVVALVMGESMAVALVGGVCGIGVAKAFTLGGDPTHGMLPAFYLSTSSVAAGIGIAGAVGMAAGVIPAALTVRLRIIDALRRV